VHCGRLIGGVGRAPSLKMTGAENKLILSL
jgi:hypothetical protein